MTDFQVFTLAMVFNTLTAFCFFLYHRRKDRAERSQARLRLEVLPAEREWLQREHVS